MKVSIITVCYNSASTIADTIRSVLEQSYDDIEYIIIDGQSKDETLKIIDEYRDSVSKIVSEPDKGIYDAMNKGLALASGDAITFLNSDDVFANEGVVQTVVDAMQQSGVDLVFGDIQFVKGKEVVRHYSSKNFKPWQLRFGWMPPHPGSLAKRELFQRLGTFDASLKLAADYEMYVRWLLVGGASFSRVDDVLVHMSLGGASTVSWRARLQANREIVTACRNNNIYTNLLLILSKMPFKLLELSVKSKNGQSEIIS